ncbi:hypothetical protein BDK51DRAFT_46079 [Blyttiomyces helicus]|uniref:Uncharacterized protein n=1 Tax=Blyttiomyces helicus TaxID=388810 RepID=A0A4P9W687_9FUNG|nr:hypothetical protein BDK51DRAFT_46079 [Blyttiomyces helicus]|eukprot:RKO87492.1 hypothetical protein BDK51DRAFT_46079 [Blyttiomyces helicus]
MHNIGMLAFSVLVFSVLLFPTLMFAEGMMIGQGRSRLEADRLLDVHSSHSLERLARSAPNFGPLSYSADVSEVTSHETVINHLRESGLFWLGSIGGSERDPRAANGLASLDPRSRIARRQLSLSGNSARRGKQDDSGRADQSDQALSLPHPLALDGPVIVSLGARYDHQLWKRGRGIIASGAHEMNFSVWLFDPRTPTPRRSSHPLVCPLMNNSVDCWSLAFHCPSAGLRVHRIRSTRRLCLWLYQLNRTSVFAPLHTEASATSIGRRIRRLVRHGLVSTNPRESNTTDGASESWENDHLRQASQPLLVDDVGTREELLVGLDRRLRTRPPRGEQSRRATEARAAYLPASTLFSCSSRPGNENARPILPVRSIPCEELTDDHV